MQRTKTATRSLYKSYFRALYLSRLALVAFWGCFVYFLLWSIPWIGLGLSTKDYTPQVTVTWLFAASCMLLGLLSGTLRATARHKREALVAWASLYDEATGMHNRRHFYDRLSLECERSLRHGSSFALLLLQLTLPPPKPGQRAGASADFLHTAADLLKEITRASDPISLISNDEFGVLLCGIDEKTALTQAERLRCSFEAGLTKLLDEPAEETLPRVKAGIAIYGSGGETPDALVETARASLEHLRGSLPQQTAIDRVA